MRIFLYQINQYFDLTQNAKIDDYYQLAQYYSNKYSVSDLKRSILPKIQTLNTDSPTLNNLLDLKFHSIWTTNFDNAIENCLFSKK